MAITTMTALQAAMPGQTLNVYKSLFSGGAAGSYYDCWTRSGTPTNGATPATGSGEAYTSASTGAPSFTNPAGSNKLHLARVSINSNAAGLLTIYDRLVATSGLSGTVTTAQTINSTALTRYTDGVGVQAFLVVYSMIGSTAVSFTIDYVDETGASVTSPTTTTIANAGLSAVQLIPIRLNSNGIRSVSSLTLAASTGTAGNMGILLLRPLATVRLLADTGSVFDPVTLGLPQVQSSACLAFYLQTAGSVVPTFTGELSLAQG